MPESLVTEVTMRATVIIILTLAFVVAVKSFDIQSFYALTVSQSGNRPSIGIIHQPLVNIATHGFKIDLYTTSTEIKSPNNPVDKSPRVQVGQSIVLSCNADDYWDFCRLGLPDG